MPTDTAVRLVNVSKIYRQRRRPSGLVEGLKVLVRPSVTMVDALRQVNLQVGTGEIVAYAGPNGAGKSTTIKLLAGLLTPESGHVRVLGLDPTRQRERHVRNIGLVFGQRTELWWDQPVSATFEWRRVVWGVPRHRYDHLCAFVRHHLGLDEVWEALARELSLGQRMRADLGLALLHEPPILLLDEPTLGLDVLGRQKMIEIIKQLNRERQMTVLVTSHDMAELEQLAGRIVLIHRGEIAFDGDFCGLRGATGDRRRLVLITDDRPAPVLTGAQLVDSDGTRHEYSFDAATCNVADLLQQATTTARVLDLETHRAPIDEVFVDLYQRWHAQGPDQA